MTGKLDNSWSSDFSKELKLSNKPTSCPMTSNSNQVYGKTNSAVNKSLAQRQKNASSINSLFKGGGVSDYITTQPMCKPGYTAHNVGKGPGSSHNVNLAKHANTLKNWNKTQNPNETTTGGGKRKKKSLKRKKVSKKHQTKSKRTKSKMTKSKMAKSKMTKKHRYHRRRHRKGGNLKKKTVSWGCFS